MKIYTTSNAFFGSIRSFFANHDVEILPKDYSKIVADLIVFPGGEDINPKIYNSKENKGWETNPRDTWELDVLRSIRRGKLRTKKTLGICRGIQLLNVGFGGTLIFDIRTRFGKGHDSVHPIAWQYENPFSKVFSVTNSLHHQCIESFGDFMPARILAVEPNTSTIEIAVWEDSFLGFQSHPELLPDSRPEKKRIVEILEEWIDGKVSMYSFNVKRIKSTATDWTIYGGS